MDKEIENFLNKVLNKEMSLLQIHEKILYIIDEVNDSGDTEYCPTLLINNDKIILNMTISQASKILMKNYIEEINKFDIFLKKYIDIYEQITIRSHIEKIFKYIKITYDIKSKIYDLNFIIYNDIFYKREEISMTKSSFNSAIRTAMNCMPNIIYVGNLKRQDYDENLNDENTIYSKDYGRTILSNITTNQIYSSDKHILDNMFVINDDGYYENNELLEAIQSYFNTIENKEYNIFNPELINNKVKIDEAILLSNMINI